MNDEIGHHRREAAHRLGLNKPKEAGIIPLRSEADLERATESAERLLREHDARLEGGDRLKLQIEVELTGRVDDYSVEDLVEYLSWQLHCSDLDETTIAVDISAVKVRGVRPL